MSETMMQEILKRLDVIGSALGNGAAFSWETMLRQALWIDGVLSVIGYGVLVLLAVKCFAWARATVKRAREQRTHGFVDEIGPIGAAMGGGILVLIAVFGLWDGIAHILNPQYYALMDLANLLGR